SNDERSEGDARGVAELVAAKADDAFEEGGAQEEQDERDADQARPGADVAGAAGGQPVQDHAQADRPRDDERPGVGPTLVVVGGVLDQQDQARHRDDAAEDGEALANGAPRGERDEEDQDAGGDDEERPAVVTDVDPHELAGQQDRPDQDEQPTENHRRATRAARRLANGGAPGAPPAARGRVSRLTWVSTANPGMPKATPSTTLAVLRPTPGNVTRSSIRGGTSPWKRSIRAALAAMIVLALTWKNPVGLIIASTSAGLAWAR